MASYLDNLKTRRTAIASELAALTSTAAGGLPNASGEGLNIDHMGYRLSLYKELDEINALILKSDPDDADAGGNEAGIVVSEEY